MYIAFFSWCGRDKLARAALYSDHPGRIDLYKTIDRVGIDGLGAVRPETIAHIIIGSAVDMKIMHPVDLHVVIEMMMPAKAGDHLRPL